MQIEESHDCSNDYLEVYRGTDLVGRFCGFSIPESVSVFPPEGLRLRFGTDESETRRGFKAVYKGNYVLIET